MKGYMYILRCSDGSYYVGSTKNLERRLAQHQAGEGANYTKKRLPVELVYYEEFQRIDEAFYREKQVQGWSRKKKEALILNKPEDLHLLSACKNNTHFSNYNKDSASFGSAQEASLRLLSEAETSEAETSVVKTRWLSEAETTAYLGNKELMKLPKTAFLCSRKVPASVVLKCYDWAIEQREKGVCVISGFHSQIEKDVLHYLLKGKQPIILALARGLKEKLEPEFEKPLEQGRLLIITPFDKSIKRVTEQTAATRNKLMIDLADQITIGYASPGGQLEELLKGTEKSVTKIV
jgi:predicted GIY-YIG superfamily endonuclease